MASYSEARNLDRWKASGEPETWVRNHLEGWNHSDWLQLLSSLRASQYWPMNEAEVGRHLEMLRPKLKEEPPRGHGSSGFWAREEWEILHFAEIGDVQKVRALLSHDPGLVNARATDGGTPLNTASLNGHCDVVEALLSYRADVNATAGRGWTPLHNAASAGFVEVLSLLLSKGADPNKRDQNGATPLHWVAGCGGRPEHRKELAQLLLAGGADVNARDHWGRTPLELAVAAANGGVAELLRQLGGRR